MYFGLATLVVLTWFFGGVLYREKLFYKAAQERAHRHNEFVKAMEAEFGEYKVSAAASKHHAALYCEPTVSKGRWGARLGW